MVVYTVYNTEYDGYFLFVETWPYIDMCPSTQPYDLYKSTGSELEGKV